MKKKITLAFLYFLSLYAWKGINNLSVYRETKQSKCSNQRKLNMGNWLHGCLKTKGTQCLRKQTDIRNKRKPISPETRGTHERGMLGKL